MADTFDLETRDGFRKVEFDPDSFRFRDVRILVDGDRVATLPYPKPPTPYHEVAFNVGDHRLVGVVHLSAGPDGTDLTGLRYDLFADGRSLTDGSPLAEARTAAPAPGEAYPRAFAIVDMVLRIAPAASAPGIVIGVARPGSGLGVPAVIGLVVLMLTAMGLATMIASRAWTHIRVNPARSVEGRTAIGCAAVLACYAVVLGGVLALAVIIGAASR